jgi:hypothetical protein
LHASNLLQISPGRPPAPKPARQGHQARPREAPSPAIPVQTHTLSRRLSWCALAHTTNSAPYLEPALDQRERSADLSSTICAAHQICRRRGQIYGSAWAQHRGHSRWTSPALPVACAVTLTVHVEHAQLVQLAHLYHSVRIVLGNDTGGAASYAASRMVPVACIISHPAQDQDSRRAALAGRPGAPGGADRDQREPDKRNVWRATLTLSSAAPGN